MEEKKQRVNSLLKRHGVMHSRWLAADSKTRSEESPEMSVEDRLRKDLDEAKRTNIELQKKVDEVRANNPNFVKMETMGRRVAEMQDQKKVDAIYLKAYQMLVEEMWEGAVRREGEQTDDFEYKDEDDFENIEEYEEYRNERRFRMFRDAVDDVNELILEMYPTGEEETEELQDEKSVCAVLQSALSGPYSSASQTDVGDLHPRPDYQVVRLMSMHSEEDASSLRAILPGLKEWRPPVPEDRDARLKRNQTWNEMVYSSDDGEDGPLNPKKCDYPGKAEMVKAKEMLAGLKACLEKRGEEVGAFEQILDQAEQTAQWRTYLKRFDLTGKTIAFYEDENNPPPQPFDAAAHERSVNRMLAMMEDMPFDVIQEVNDRFGAAASTMTESFDEMKSKKKMKRRSGSGGPDEKK